MRRFQGLSGSKADVGKSTQSGALGVIGFRSELADRNVLFLAMA
jgi:hypothetical protein